MSVLGCISGIVLILVMVGIAGLGRNALQRDDNIPDE